MSNQNIDGIGLQTEQTGPSQFTCKAAGNLRLVCPEIEGQGITEKFAIKDWFAQNDLALRLSGPTEESGNIFTDDFYQPGVPL